MLKTEDYLILKKVINNNFTFSDLSPRFKDVDSSTGNIFCPFHENHVTPAAKMYWDDTKDIWILHCFGECHRNYTAFDYVDLLLCKSYGKYKSPLEFLKVNMNNSLLYSQIDLYKKFIQEDTQNFIQDKINYINNTYSNCNGDIIDYIEALYSSK